MELVVFTGIQASGKSTFYKERFFGTHLRISLDMLKTRRREEILFKACLAAKQPVVIDNTNCERADRARYIEPAKAAGFRIVGYYFRSSLEECKHRNSKRTGRQRIPDPGLHGAYGRLEMPSLDEGFDCLNYVSIKADNTFSVEDWQDEV